MSYEIINRLQTSRLRKRNKALFDDAIAEIERLRAVIDRMDKIGHTIDRELTAENETLRAERDSWRNRYLSIETDKARRERLSLS